MNDLILIQTAAGLFLVGFLLFLLFGIKFHRLNKYTKETLLKCDALQSHITAMCSAAVNIGNSIDQLDRKIELLTDRQEKYELKEPRGKTRTYSQAKMLLNNGVKLNEIVEHCGMSYGEVELVAMMNKLEEKKSRH